MSAGAPGQWDSRNRGFVSPTELRQYNASPPRSPPNQYNQPQIDMSMGLSFQPPPPSAHSPLGPQRIDANSARVGSRMPLHMQQPGAPTGVPMAGEMQRTPVHGLESPGMQQQQQRPPGSGAQVHNRTQSSGGGFFSNFRKNSTLNPVQRQTSRRDAQPDEFGTGPRGQQAQTVPARPSSIFAQASSQSLSQQGHGVPEKQPVRRPSTQQGAPPLHPEMKSVVTLSLAHAHKIYFSGPLVRHVERQADGHRVTKDEGWQDVWAQLGGTTLSIWDMKEIEVASKEGREVPPTYINVTDAFVQVLGSVTIPAAPDQPSRKYTNVLTVNTAGSNLILFACPSTQALISWASALRLSAWEKSRLEEIYTAHLIRTTLALGGVEPQTSLTRGRLEGWVKVRLSGQTDWKRLWMVVTAANSAPGHVSNTSHELALVDSRSSSPTVPKKNRMSALFGRSRDSSPPPPTGATPGQPLIVLYSGPKGKDRKKPALTVRGVTQVFAVYPERPELISRSTLIKLEGLMGEEEVMGGMKGREAWLLMMPEVEPGKDGSAEMLKWAIAFHDAFQLYGRPRSYSWDPRNPASLMFAYPIGPHKDLLFLDRELAEGLDPRDDRTSAVRARLLNILVERMRNLGGGPLNVTEPPAASDAPLSLPFSGGMDPQNQSPPPSQNMTYKNDSSLPQLPPFTFDSERSSPPPPAVTHSGRRRDLSPIRERSTAESLQGEPRQHSGSGDRFTPPSVHSNTVGSRQHSLAAQYEGDEHHQSPPRRLSSPVLSGRMLTKSPSPTPQESELAYTSSTGTRDQPAFSPTSRPDSKLSYHSGPTKSFTSSSQDATRQVDPTNMQLPPSSMNSPDSSLHHVSPMVLSPPELYHQYSPPPPSIPPSPQRDALSPTTVNNNRLSAFSHLTSPYSVDGDRHSPTAQSIDMLGSFIPPPPPLPNLPPPPVPSGAAVQTPPPPPPILPSPPAQPEPTPEAPASIEPTKSDDYVFDEPGALYFMQQNGGGSGPSVRSPPPMHGTDEGDDASSSERGPSPPIRESAREAASSPPRPAVSDSADTAANAPRSSGLGRKPSGARAPPARRVANYGGSQGSLAEDPEDAVETHPPPLLSAPLATSTTLNTMDSTLDAQADALAALTFLEREEKGQVATPHPHPALPPPPGQPQIIEPEHRAPSPSEDGPSQGYRSSFAPSRQAAERKARLEAQQAAQQAAAHQPGRSNGRKKEVQDRGAWNDSSDEEEEEEEEEEEDDDVDSDGGHQASSREAKNRAAPPFAPVPQAPIRPLHPQHRDLSPSASAISMPNTSPRGSRHLPPPPGNYSPAGSDDAHAHPERYSQYPRRNFVDESGPMRQPSPQMRPQGEHHPAGARPTVWSNVLEPGRSVDLNANQRDTFVQLNPNSESMTKAFTPQGLLSAGLQDKQDRSAKRQEELARESGASLINVPNKPPPPQVGLLGAITAHERERKREGGVGAALTEREREKRLAEERQRKLDDLQRQQLEQQQQMMQSGTMSVYGGQQGQFGGGYNPMMMMGMNPMMMNMMGFPGMMNPQQMFAAQQAAQAYQQAMMTFSQAGSQYGGNGGGDGATSPPQGMGGIGSGMANMSGFDPRMSMMMGGSPMASPMPMGQPMGQPMGSQLGPSPVGSPGASGLNPNMNNMSMNMGMGMGVMPSMNMGGMGGMGLPMQMTGNTGFDPRFSMSPSQFEGMPTTGGGGPQIHSYSSSPAPPEGSSLEDGPSEHGAEHRPPSPRA